jgi:hypothetical protein
MKKHVTAYFSIPEDNNSEVLDLRNLEAPEPMERILLSCAQLEVDDYFMAHLPHVPAPLFPHLVSRGLDWQVLEEDDGSAIVLIRRKE